MKSKLFKRIAASVLAAALAAAPLVTLAETAAPAIGKAFTAMPGREAEEPANDIKIPEGYNEHDYLKLRAFLETEDEEGVKNGEKLYEYMDDMYDPDDPETWGESFSWTDTDDGKRIEHVYTDRLFYGKLDLSGCTALAFLLCTGSNVYEIDVNGCTALVTLYCSCNQLTKLDVSGSTALAGLYCDQNQLTELDVSSNTALEELDCFGNQLTELDVSNNTALWRISCDHNQLTELDVSQNTALTQLSCGYNKLTALDVSSCTGLKMLECDNNKLTELDVSQNTALEKLNCDGNQFTALNLENCKIPCLTSVVSKGNGWVGCGIESRYDNGIMYEDYFLWAKPMPGCTFDGWYSPDGELLSTEQSLLYYSAEEGYYGVPVFGTADFTAKFTGGNTGVPGDVDGDGETTVNDALFAIRGAMSLLNFNADQALTADMDGDGYVTVGDALTIIRIAMGV